MTDRIRLTPDRIRRFACPAGQKLFFDSEMPRLAVRVTKGAKSFVFQGFLNRATVRLTIGSVDDWSPDAARAEARRLQMLLDRGIDPREEKVAEKAAKQARVAAETAAKHVAEQAQRYTLAALLEAYCQHLRTRGKDKSARAAKSAFKNVPADLLERPAKDVTAREIAAVIRAVHEAGKPRTAGVLRAFLSAAYNAARHAEFDPALPSELIGFEVTTNPAEAVKPIPVARRDRVLSLTELRAYLAHLGDDPTDCALRMALLAGGQRMAQLLRAAATDWDGATLRLTDGKGRRSTPREHLLPLAPIAADLAGRLASRGPWLFSYGTRPMSPETPGKRVAKISARMNGEPFDLRDIRRTCETLLAGLGISRDTRAQLLSHGLSGVQAAHYDRHSYAAEKHAALVAWEVHLTSGTGGNVVAYARRA